MASGSAEPIIWLVSQESGKSIPLVRVTGFSWPSWSPNGMIIAYTSGESGNSDIWVLTVPNNMFNS
ncbi:MAG: PD40 domain-containing protein [Candidatus Cloacimonetes bacterium]|nr:PD40 domain-containing protein [Candidatus Cloacimonadota bacterium]